MKQPTAGEIPNCVTLDGRYCRLEPLEINHAPSLFAAISGEGVKERHRYLFEEPPATPSNLAAWISTQTARNDAIFFAVIDKETGKCGGRQAFLRLRPEHRSIEVGSVLWGRGIARTRIATEALFLTAKHVFDDLRYYRFEWKCNALNIPSCRAAIRFGFTFEGIFRKDMVLKNQHRDTAWYAMIDSDWPDLKSRFEEWLDPSNFDENGLAKTNLAVQRT